MGLVVNHAMSSAVLDADGHTLVCLPKAQLDGTWSGLGAAMAVAGRGGERPAEPAAGQNPTSTSSAGTSGSAVSATCLPRQPACSPRANGGVGWARDKGIYRCHVVLFHPTLRDLLFATITARGVGNGIWKSEDGGVSWRQLTQGLPFTASIGRTSLAIAPSDPESYTRSPMSSRCPTTTPSPSTRPSPTMWSAAGSTCTAPPRWPDLAPRHRAVP
jgi:hypothetical protein